MRFGIVNERDSLSLAWCVISVAVHPQVQLQDLLADRGKKILYADERGRTSASIRVPSMFVKFPELPLKIRARQIVIVKVKGRVQGTVITVDQGWAPEGRGNGFVHRVDSREAPSAPLMHKTRVLGRISASVGAIMVYARCVD